MTNNNPIGLFDSGVGGTSIWREIHNLMPLEDTIYLADSKNAPYGVKSKEEIIALSKKNTEFLLNLGCKLIVVACNTATTNAIKELRASYDVPFIGIEPAIKPAVLRSQSGKIGVLATKGTLSSELFHKAVETYHDAEIIEQVGTGLVELIESGELDSPRMRDLLQKYTTPMVDAGIDYLVLGCSHYPYLIPTLRQVLPEHIRIIDSGEAVARQSHHVLEEKAGLKTSGNGKAIFYTNADTTVLKQLVGAEYRVLHQDF
jgi:glutamate racemase